MQPAARLSFDYPIYSLIPLSPTTYAISGGGGLMKSGIPNKLQILTLTSTTPPSLHLAASLALPDAPVALAAQHNTLHSLISTGMKSFLFQPPKTLTTASDFTHDLLISSTVDQSAIALSASYLVIASDEGQLTVLQFPHYDLVYTITPHTQGVTDLVLHPSLPLIATTSRDKTALLTNLHTGHLIQALHPTQPKLLRTHIRAIRFTSTPGLLFTIESNPRKGGWLAAWRSSDALAGNFAPVATIHVSADALTAFTVNSDATLAAVSSAEGHVVLLRWNGRVFGKVWTTEPAKKWLRAPTPPHVLPVTGMCFTKSGDCLLTASADYTVAVWSTQAQVKRVGLATVLFWAFGLLVALFVVAIRGDRHLGEEGGKGGNVAAPFLEPALSNVRHKVRPAMNKGVDGVMPFLEKSKPYLFRVFSIVKKQRSMEEEEADGGIGRKHNKKDRTGAVESDESNSDGADVLSDSESASISRDGIPKADVFGDNDSYVVDPSSEEVWTDVDRETVSKPREPDPTHSSEELLHSSGDEKPKSIELASEILKISKPGLGKTSAASDGDALTPGDDLAGSDQPAEVMTEDNTCSTKVTRVDDGRGGLDMGDKDAVVGKVVDGCERRIVELHICEVCSHELHNVCDARLKAVSWVREAAHEIEWTKDKPLNKGTRGMGDTGVRISEAAQRTVEQVDTCYRENLAFWTENLLDRSDIYRKELKVENKDVDSIVRERAAKQKGGDISSDGRLSNCDGDTELCSGFTGTNNELDVGTEKGNRLENDEETANSVAESGEGESEGVTHQTVYVSTAHGERGSAKPVAQQVVNLGISKEGKGFESAPAESLVEERKMTVKRGVRGSDGFGNLQSAKVDWRYCSIRQGIFIKTHTLKTRGNGETGCGKSGPNGNMNGQARRERSAEQALRIKERADSKDVFESKKVQSGEEVGEGMDMRIAEREGSPVKDEKESGSEANGQGSSEMRMQSGVGEEEAEQGMSAVSKEGECGRHRTAMMYLQPTWTEWVRPKY